MDVVQDLMMTKNSLGMRQTNIVYRKENDCAIHNTNLTSAVPQAAAIMINLFGPVLSKVGLSFAYIIRALVLSNQNVPIEIHCIGKYISGACTPYSESACRLAAEKAGLELGRGKYKFASFTYGNKGCYTYVNGDYKGSAYYGLGGDSTSISEPYDVTTKYYRPEGYDCSQSNLIQNNSKQILIIHNYLVIS